MRWLCIPTLVVALGAAAHADDSNAELPSDPEALAHFERGEKLGEQGDLSGALAEFRKGYALEPRRVFLFAMAQAEMYREQCDEALRLYRQFLEKNPPQEQADSARKGIEQCGGDPAIIAPPTETAGPSPTGAPSQTNGPGPTSGSGPPDNRWYRDRVGASLVGGGVLSFGLGATAMLLSRSNAEDARNAESLQVHEDKAGRSRAWGVAAALGLGAGAALTTVGILRFVHEAKREPVVSANVTSDSITLSLAGRF